MAITRVKWLILAPLCLGITSSCESQWRQFGTVANSPETCDALKEKSVDEPQGTKLYAATDYDRLQKLAYDTKIKMYSYDAPEGTEPNEHGIIDAVGFVKTIQRVPDVALKVRDGWLVGADRGEWGGELVHVAADGTSTVLFEENIAGIFRLADGVVAISGLAHLQLNRGLLLRISEEEPGHFVAIPWRRLPGAPASSWLLEDDELLVNTYGGGSVIVDKTGDFRMAQCISN